MSLYVSLTKLDYALGGVMLHSGSFLAPLKMIIDGVKSNSTAVLKPPKENLRFLIYHGDKDDQFFANKTLPEYTKLFENLGISNAIDKNSTTVTDLGHKFSPEGSKAFIKWAEDSTL